MIGQGKTSENIIQEIQTTGFYKGKAAYVFRIVGRRAGFNNITDPHDLKEFDSASNFFTELTGSESLEVVSSSVNDTNTAGTGIRQVKVTYLDNSNNIQVSSAISLDGTTPVAAGFTAKEILWMEAASSGSLRIAQGNIRLRVVAGVEVEQITAKSSKSKTGKFQVPAGYTGYLDTWNAAAINNDQEVFILSQCDSYTRVLTSGYKMQDNLCIAVNNLGFSKLPFLKIPELARVKLSTISAGTAASVRCCSGFTIIIIAN